VPTNAPDLAVLGLGYVGMPLVRQAVAAGLGVVGIDPNAAKVEGLRAGRSHVDDLTDTEIAALLKTGFMPTVDPGALRGADTVVICVPTPLSEDGAPDLSAVISAAETVAAHLSRGTLVVLESTTYPGTTEEILRPILEQGGLKAGTDFNLAYSPERIDPGNPVWGIANTPKVIGGVTSRCTERAAAFYGKFIDTVVPVKGTREAEMAKLLENTYRHINIALVNEMAVFCDELGIDLWESIRAAQTKPFGFQAFFPGPGVGGHCIPIDPNYLSYKVRTLGYPFRFVELAQEINARMPAYVAMRVQRLLNAHRKPVNGSSILLLGVTYKPDIADERESPARPLARRLLELGAELSFHDPYVARWSLGDVELERVADLSSAVTAADLVLVTTLHSSYDLHAIAADAACIFDTRGRLDGPNVERL